MPLGRVGGADDHAGRPVFRPSPGSHCVTGQELIVDGGRSAW